MSAQQFAPGAEAAPSTAACGVGAAQGAAENRAGTPRDLVQAGPSRAPGVPPASLNPKDYVWGAPTPQQQQMLFQQFMQMAFMACSAMASGAAGQPVNPCCPPIAFPQFAMFPPLFPGMFPAAAMMGRKLPDGCAKPAGTAGVAGKAKAAPRAPKASKKPPKPTKKQAAGGAAASASAFACDVPPAAATSNGSGAGGSDLLMFDDEVVLSDSALQAMGGDFDDLDFDMLLHSMDSGDANNDGSLAVAGGSPVVSGGSGLQRGRSVNSMPEVKKPSSVGSSPRSHRKASSPKATGGVRKAAGGSRTRGGAKASVAAADADADAAAAAAAAAAADEVEADAFAAVLHADVSGAMLEWPEGMGLKSLLDDPLVDMAQLLVAA